MKNKNLKCTVLSAMFLAIGIVLPFLTGQIQQFGNMLLPMHIPVLLCGLICGAQYGLTVGFIMPLLRSALFSMPVMFPNAFSMAFELATYGFVIGLLYSRSPWKCIKALYMSMLTAMISGRIVWGIVQMLLIGVGADGFTVKAFISGALLNAVPGIIIQLILIPAIMTALKLTKPLHFSHKQKDNNCSHERNN